MLTSAIQKQTSVCCSISLNPYVEKRKKGIDSAYIADVSVLTNPVIHANIVFNMVRIGSEF